MSSNKIPRIMYSLILLASFQSVHSHAVGVVEMVMEYISYFGSFSGTKKVVSLREGSVTYPVISDSTKFEEILTYSVSDKSYKIAGKIVDTLMIDGKIKGKGRYRLNLTPKGEFFIIENGEKTLIATFKSDGGYSRPEFDGEKETKSLWLGLQGNSDSPGMPEISLAFVNWHAGYIWEQTECGWEIIH